jgi:hypothetical protein
MNKLIPIVLIIVGLTISSGSIDITSSAPLDIKQAAVSTMPLLNTQTAASSTIQKMQATSISLNQELPIEEKIKPPAVKRKEFRFDYVNGISLYDDVKAVTDKLGQPLSKGRDPNFAELELYAYPEMNISFSDGVVNYVEVLVAAGTVDIDGIPISIDEEGLKKALGEADYVAEDGIVFQRKEALIKLFTSMDTQKVTSLHYYHHSNI